MTMQDPLSDMLTRIRNAQTAKIEAIEMPYSGTKLAIAEVLKQEGYIIDFSVDDAVKRTLSIDLKYHEGRPVIEEIKRLSRPGLRQYKGKDEIPVVRSGLDLFSFLDQMIIERLTVKVSHARLKLICHE